MSGVTSGRARGHPGHTLLRELTLVGNHNSYHLGEFAVLRQVMGGWPPGQLAALTGRGESSGVWSVPKPHHHTRPR